MKTGRTSGRGSRLARCAARVVMVSMVSLGAAGWYAAGQFLAPRRERPHHDVLVRRVDPGRVVLDRTEWTERKGVWGLEWEGGYAQVGHIFRLGRSDVERALWPLQGTLRVGQHVAMDPWAFPGDPALSFGVPFSDAAVPSALGPLPAWYVAGSSDTWVIFVHGRDANRREALRMMPAAIDLGLPCLVITYRNDLEAPASSDGLYHLGETEWEDVDSAAGYALGHGARRLVLVGFSMGGAIVSEFLHRSAHTSSVVGVILDSPVLDWGATVNLVGRGRGVPGPLMSLEKGIVSIRYEADWRELNEAVGLDRGHTPVLLFHGTEDDVVPIETSDALAAARQGTVTYVRVAGARHVESWNLAPARYREAVQDFLGLVA